MRDKLLKAAAFAVTEERGRVLWCIDQVLAELKAKVNTKLLSAVQLHAVELKFKIAEAVAAELRRAIVSGARPGQITGQKPGSADPLPLGRCRICEREFDDPRGCDKSLPHHESSRLKP